MSGLRKVDAPFVTVDNAIAEDSALSYRARGVLVSLLAKPDGWAVRAEAIARGGTEGRDAILTVLRELGARGHYRIVRYREGGPGGPWKTETEVAHRPRPEWVEEWKRNGGGPVVLKADPQVSPENGFPGLGDDPSDANPQVAPENGFPDVGNPASGEAASGDGAAITKTLSNETEGKAGASAPSRPDLKVVKDSEPTVEQRAEHMLRAWWDWLTANDATRVPSQSYISVKKIVVPALASHRPERLIEAGLNVLIGERRAISQGTLATAMTQAARHPSAPEEFRPWADGDPTQSGTARTRPNANYSGDDRTGGWGQAALDGGYTS